jgi:putative ABC transport system permease protein
MLKLILKQTLARRARLGLTMVAVTLGVTFVTGALVLTDTAQRAFDSQFTQAASGVDVTVRKAVAFDAAMGVEVSRDPLPPRVVDRVRTTAGVDQAIPVAKGSGLIVSDGKAIVPQGPTMLSSWTPAPVGAFTLREGQPPSGRDEVAIDLATATAHHLGIGDAVTVQAERTARLRIVGLAGFGDEDGIPNSTIALVTTGTAQRLLALGAGVSEVAVTADDDTSTGALRDRLTSELGAHVEVAASQDTAEAAAAAAKTQLGYIEIMLLILAGAALLIGAFLIANTFSIVVTQRTRELAMLRATGATGRQVVLSVLGEAVLVGVLGSAAGGGLGVLAAAGMRTLVRAFGVAVPDSGLVVTPRTVLITLLVGILVTGFAALAPSRRAAKISPVTAMRLSDQTEATSRRRRNLAVVTLVIAALLTAAGLLGEGSPVLVGLGATTAVLALVAVGPVLVPGLIRTVGRPLSALGVPGTMAQQAASRAPRRVASTVTALALSLALIAFMAVLGSTIKSSVRSTYTETVSADLTVESARNEMLGGLVPATYERVRRLEEVQAVSRLRYGHWKDGSTTRALTAVDPATLPSVTNLDLVQGRLADLDAGGILLAEKAATDRGVSVGDRLAMTFARTGTRHLTVIGLLEDADAQALGTDYIVSLETYARLFSERMDASLFVKVADGVSVATAQRAIDDALAGYPTAEVRDQAAAVDGRTATIDQVLGMVNVLLVFTVLIAMLGITNTLALSIVERTREIGMLRAVGMTRRQLRHMVQGEALLVATAALLGGAVLGVGYAVAAVVAVGRSTPVSLTIPVGSLLLVLLLALAVGVLAGLAPARRAAKLDVLTAISAE